MINRFGPKACGICHRDIARGEEMQVAPGMSGPRGGKVYSHAHCTPARANPPKGRASGFFDEHPGGSIAGMVRGAKKTYARQERKQRRKAGKRQVQTEMMEMMEPVSMEPITRQKHPAEGALEGVVIYTDGGYSPTYYASFDAFFSTPEEAQRYISLMRPNYVDAVGAVWVEELTDVSRSDEHGGNPTVYGVRTGMKSLADYYGRPMAFASIYREMGQKRTLRAMRDRRGARANPSARGKRRTASDYRKGTRRLNPAESWRYTIRYMDPGDRTSTQYESFRTTKLPEMWLREAAREGNDQYVENFRIRDAGVYTTEYIDGNGRQWFISIAAIS